MVESLKRGDKVATLVLAVGAGYLIGGIRSALVVAALTLFIALGATSVTTAKIAAAAVTDAKVASGISGAKLTDGTVTAAKLLTSDIDRSLNVASGKYLWN